MPTRVVSNLFERTAFDAQQQSTLAAARCRLVGAVVALIGSDTASMFDAPWEPEAAGHLQRIAGWGTPNVYRERWIEHRQRWGKSMHRLINAMQDGPAVDSDVYTAYERAKLAVYQEAFLPQRASSVLATFVQYGGRRTAALWLKRLGRTRPFGTREVTLLSSLLPAIGLADAGFQFALEATANSPDTHVLFALSPREQQVARLACKGMRNNEIASLLGTSTETVKKQIRSAMGKLDVSNRTELAMVWASQLSV